MAGLDEYAWYGANSGNTTHPVGGKLPNAWGLYDMHGNVREWCQDWYDEGYYARSAADDPAGPSQGTFHVNRGGSYYTEPGTVRSAFRAYDKPDFRRFNIGFRVCLIPADATAEQAKTSAVGEPSPAATPNKPSPAVGAAANSRS